MDKLARPLRFLISGLIAVAILLFGGGWIVHEYVGDNPSQSVGLTVIHHIHLISHVPGSDKKSGQSEASDKPKRMVPGFAQVAFTVGADGRAHDIRVLRSVPKGVYDRAARAVIAARHFKPPKKSARGYEHTRIVHFQVPASSLENNDSDGGSGG